MESLKKENLKFVIVGHVDHGKSTLIGRLLFDTNSLPSEKIEEVKKISRKLGKGAEFAFLLDHLQEEREQGITIDTTQTFFSTPEREYVIIDAPGHIEFIKNMITGASQAEAGVLIVDVKEGIQGQTKRHANILSMLGLNQTIVVINKMDLVDYKREAFEKTKQELENFLTSLDIKPNYYIPISALNGDNIVEKSKKMDWYSGPTLIEGLSSFKEKEFLIEKQLIFPIQDVYDIEGKKIYVGKIESGKIEEGQKIKILPKEIIATIKSIEKFQENPSWAISGESIGITLENQIFAERGNIVCNPKDELVLTDSFKGSVFWMSEDSLFENDLINLKCSTQEVAVRIKEIKKRIDSSSLKIIEKDAKKIENLEVGEVVLKTEKPIVITKFNEIPELGRFVLIQNKSICAGGIIVF